MSCWRDDIQTNRWCGFCGTSYFGDLGHRNCQAFNKPAPPSAPDEPQDADGVRTLPQDQSENTK